MKASELRIGNWVKVPTTDGSDVFTQIEPSNFCHDCNAGISIEFLEPVRLSEEKLLKLGFEKDEALDNWYDNGKAQILFKDGVAFYNFDETEIRLDYVHQLQNTYHCLNNGEELTLKEKP